MESEEASINLQESNNALEITSKHSDGGDDSSKNSGKRKHTSEVWNHFKRVKIENFQFAECKYGKNHLKAPPSHKTTHLTNIMRRHVKDVPKKWISAKVL